MRVRFRLGDTVRVAIPATAVDTGDTITPLLRERYNGEVHRISRRVSLRLGTYYELEDVVSDRGIPYAFVRDWLEEVRRDD